MKLEALDGRLRAAMMAEPRIQFAVAYGSRTQRPGGIDQDDEFSDLEYYAYLHSGTHLEPSELIERVTPVVLAVINLFGTPNFVTPELHRIELHVENADQLPDLLGWSVWSPDPARMLVKDEGGVLASLLERFAALPGWTPEAPQVTFDRTLNALVTIRSLLLRGERLRAYEWHALWVIGGLTRLARYAKRLAQPPASHRRAELELSADVLKRIAACATGLEQMESGWACALTLCTELGASLNLVQRAALVAALREFSPSAASPPPPR